MSGPREQVRKKGNKRGFEHGKGSCSQGGRKDVLEAVEAAATSIAVPMGKTRTNNESD